ncbi:MAG: hypothetical protein AB8G22_03410 [Saprospiraceae bacterium]
MKAASIKEIRQGMAHLSQKELVNLIVKLGVFKKENKELLTYLLFEAEDEDAYIRSIKSEMDEQFAAVNRRSYYTIKKEMRKILRSIKKHIRYSKKTATEVELLLYFCLKMKEFSPSIRRSTVLMNIFNKQTEMIEKRIPKLHEDLQFDFQETLTSLRD